MKIEINGRIVEVDDSFANLSADDQQKTVEEIASSINPTKQKSEAGLAMQMAAPAITGAAFATPTGIQQAGKVATSAVAPLVKEVALSYLNKPATAVADAILLHAGIPPLAGPASGAMERVSAIKEGMREASKQASMGSPTLSPVRGVPTTTTIAPYFDMLKSAGPEVADKISNIWNTKGGNNAVRSWLNSAEGQALMKANPNFAEKAAAYIAETPSLFSQAGRMMKPLAVGAARVAGPAALGYDVYEATKFAREQGLGERLAAGEGKLAPQAFRGMLNQNISGYQPSAQEAQNLLQSGDMRTINIYGGPNRLNDIIRREAEKRLISGPVAPGRM